MQFDSTTFQDDYDYRIWHKSNGSIFYQNVSADSFTFACSILHTLRFYDESKGVKTEAQGLECRREYTAWQEWENNEGKHITDFMAGDVRSFAGKEPKTRWFLQFFCESNCDWRDSFCGDSEGYRTEQEVLDFTVAFVGTYRAIEREVAKPEIRWIVQYLLLDTDDCWRDSSYNEVGGYRTFAEAEVLFQERIEQDTLLCRIIKREVSDD